MPGFLPRDAWILNIHAILCHALIAYVRSRMYVRAPTPAARARTLLIPMGDRQKPSPNF
jgi:hypothetical protein